MWYPAPPCLPACTVFFSKCCTISQPLPLSLGSVFNLSILPLCLLVFFFLLCHLPLSSCLPSCILCCLHVSSLPMSSCCFPLLTVSSQSVSPVSPVYLLFTFYLLSFYCLFFLNSASSCLLLASLLLASLPLSRPPACPTSRFFSCLFFAFFCLFNSGLQSIKS